MYGKFETFVHDILDDQEEVIMDEAITVRELFGVLKLGALRFYLCTKSPVDVGDKDNELGNSNVNMDELNHVRERDEQMHTETDAFLDSSEVETGPNVGEPIANQLNDTLPYQPVLQFEDVLSVTPVILPIYSALITLD